MGLYLIMCCCVTPNSVKILFVGTCVHSLHGLSDTWRVHMDGQKKVQALPGASQRPVQTQNDAAVLASGEVIVHTQAHANSQRFICFDRSFDLVFSFHCSCDLN